MSAVTTMKWAVKFTPVTKGARRLGCSRRSRPASEQGRIPRVARLMALAIKFEGMIRDGVVKDYAELGRLGKVTRARISQIMALTTLAPDIQEAILHLHRVVRGREPIKLRDLLRIAGITCWSAQRQAWTILDNRV